MRRCVLAPVRKFLQRLRNLLNKQLLGIGAALRAMSAFGALN